MPVQPTGLRPAGHMVFPRNECRPARTHPDVNAHYEPWLLPNGRDWSSAPAGQCRTGCLPITPFLSMLFPAIRAGGRAAIEQFEGKHADLAPAFQVYGLGLRHKHVPEIARYAGLSVPPVFMPAYGAYRQGIVLSVPLQQRLLPKNASAVAIHACLTEHYSHSQYVKVLPYITAGDAERIKPGAPERH